jgi:hypothetical protein
MNYKVDVYTWYGQRELTYLPKHFVTASAPLTEESRQWVLDSLSGRFAVVPNVYNDIIVLDTFLGKIGFEDPKEATLFELRWS